MSITENVKTQGQLTALRDEFTNQLNQAKDAVKYGHFEDALKPLEIAIELITEHNRLFKETLKK